MSFTHIHLSAHWLAVEVDSTGGTDGGVALWTGADRQRLMAFSSVPYHNISVIHMALLPSLIVLAAPLITQYYVL